MGRGPPPRERWSLAAADDLRKIHRTIFHLELIWHILILDFKVRRLPLLLNRLSATGDHRPEGTRPSRHAPSCSNSAFSLVHEIRTSGPTRILDSVWGRGLLMTVFLKRTHCVTASGTLGLLYNYLPLLPPLPPPFPNLVKLSLRDDHCCPEYLISDSISSPSFHLLKPLESENMQFTSQGSLFS